jgi:hypothetical protein
MVRSGLDHFKDGALQLFVEFCWQNALSGGQNKVQAIACKLKALAYEAKALNCKT